ncbi:MAG: GNAT family N-acetyltransferase [Clostridiaceae bacterium]|nr:GNAT family N-acetyltransferase [Clostridiaceae bacterium]
MFQMEYAASEDIALWRRFDKHISESELLSKIADKRCYILKNNAVPVGIMRYNLFWDSLPFLTLIYLEEEARRKGYGKSALLQWESEMRLLGFPCTMTSTQADETAQFFYRRLGYRDAGCLILDTTPLAQPTEIFFVKTL